MDFITDRLTLVDERLIQQWRGAVNVPEVIKAHCLDSQSVEDTGEDLYAGRWISTAAGDALDRLGAIFGVKRDLATDSVYRARIQAAINARQSQGTINELLISLGLQTNLKDIHIIESYPAGFKVSGTVPTEGLNVTEQELINFILPFKAAGVEIVGIELGYEADGVDFAFLGYPLPAEGFADYYDLGAGGGYLTNLIYG